MDRLVLSRKLADEIMLASRLVSEVTGRHLECEGIMADKNGIPYYSIIPKQEISTGRAMLDDIVEPFAYATKERLKVSGLWHSHGAMPVFHSRYDDFHLCSTIAPLVRMQNKAVGCTASGIASIVINNKGRHCAVMLNDGRSSYCDAAIEGDAEYIDAAELLQAISANVCYKGVPLKEMEGYAKVLGYYEEVRAAVWQEVFRRGMERLERRAKNEAGKAQENSTGTKKGRKGKSGNDCKADKNPEGDSQPVAEPAGLHC